MKNECSIVKDILPLYVEGLISDETKEFVEEHLASCSECKDEADKISKPAALPSDVSAVPLITINKQLKAQRIKTSVFAVAVVAAIIISLFSYLTAPQFIPYEDKPVSITEAENGALLCTFSGAVDGYHINLRESMNSGGSEYEITAWYSLWERFFSKQKISESLYFEMTKDSPISAYYIQNNGEDDVLIYGEALDQEGMRVTLPRLFLNFYFYLSLAAAIVLTIIACAKRKNKKIRNLLTKLIPLPLSYALATVLITGFPATSYSGQRDFALIALTTIFIYLAAYMIVSINLSKKEMREMQNI